MQRIKIYHAFNGFLYAPIFLAGKLGLFPQNTDLVYTQTDHGTIEALCRDSHSSGKNWFAICDPFSVDLNTALEHTDDDIRVVGSLINVVPLWVYDSNVTVRPVSKETDLSRYRQDIKRVVSYTNGTTGYLIGSRIRNTVGVQEPLVQKDFGREFEGGPDDSTAVVTADVLRMVHYGLNKGNVVFSYPTLAPPELNPFLFTAILTLKSTVDSNLWAVLGILGAIRSAIECLNQKNVEDDYVRAVVDIYDSVEYGDVFNQLQITNPAEKMTLVREALRYLFVTEKIYNQYPRPKEEQWVKAWDNAKRTWHAHTNATYPTVQQKEEPIPTLLVRQEWKPDLAEYFRKFLYSSVNTAPPVGIKAEFLKSREKFFLICGWILLSVTILLSFFSALHVIHKFAAHSDERSAHMNWVFALLFCCIVEAISFRSMRKAVLAFKDYVVELTVWLAALAGFTTFVIAAV